jgi:hypothetical protein
MTTKICRLYGIGQKTLGGFISDEKIEIKKLEFCGPGALK